MSRHRSWGRRYGRDSYTGGRQHSWLAAIGGFLLVPTGVGIMTTLMAKPSSATPYLVAHGAATAAAWWGASKFPQLHSFLRGAMWGEGVSTVLSGVTAATDPSMALSRSAGTTKALLSPPASSAAMKLQAQALGQRLIQGGLFK